MTRLLWRVAIGYEIIDFHNGLTTKEYDLRTKFSRAGGGWYLVPFPRFKGEVFNQDNLATVNNVSFLELPWFKEAKSEADLRWARNSFSRSIDFRLYTFLTLSRIARSRCGGCYVELGVGNGYMTSALLFDEQNYTVGTFRRHLLFDSFRPQDAANFSYAFDPNEVVHYFESKECLLFPGELPQSLRKSDIFKHLSRFGLSFLHVDLNSPSVEGACLVALRSFMENTIILFDDACNPGSEYSLLIARDFAEQIGKPLLELATGQAVII